MFSSAPWKKSTSVRTDKQAAPACSYCCAISAGLKFSRIIPLEGDAFLISAITPGRLAFKALAKPRTGVAACASSSTSFKLRCFKRAANSSYLRSTILPKIVFAISTMTIIPVSV
ncbi:hypothetical protein D9M72_134400 [compost metagenome]